MTKTQDLITAAIENMDTNRATRDELPLTARNLITATYSTLIDIQEDDPEDLDLEEALRLLDEATDDVASFATSASAGDADKIHALISPANELCRHLSFTLAYGA